MVATPPRSHQLAAGTITIPNVLTEVYTAPTGKVVILKAVALHDDDGTFDHVYSYIKTGAVEYTFNELVAGTTPGTQLLAVDLVLEEGDQVGFYDVTGAGSISLRYYLSGSVLSNP